MVYAIGSARSRVLRYQSSSLAKKNLPPANRVPVRTLRVRLASTVGLVRLNFPFIALWHPLRCNTIHFCSFLCGSVHSLRPLLMPSICFLPSSLPSMTSHFCSVVCASVRSPLAPDTIHPPPYRVSCTPQTPTSLFCLRIRPQSTFSPTPFIFLLTHFPSPHDPFSLPNTTSALCRTHPALYLPTQTYSPL